MCAHVHVRYIWYNVYIAFTSPHLALSSRFVQVKGASDFEWVKNLRYYWDAEIDDCVVRMSNSRYVYGYEYLGASPRLVITPLTVSVHFHSPCVHIRSPCVHIHSALVCLVLGSVLPVSDGGITVGFRRGSSGTSWNRKDRDY